MCDDSEDDLAALAPLAPAHGAEPCRRLIIELTVSDSHRLAECLLVEPMPQPSPPLPGRWVVRRAAALRRDQGADAVRPDVLMDLRAAEAGVGQERPDLSPTGGLLQCRLERH